jgi:type III secretory pathway lipoprotein EscJ
MVAKSIEGLHYNQVAVALLPVEANNICGEIVAANTISKVRPPSIAS